MLLALRSEYPWFIGKAAVINMLSLQVWDCVPRALFTENYSYARLSAPITKQLSFAIPTIFEVSTTEADLAPSCRTWPEHPLRLKGGSTCVSYYSISMLKRTIAAIRSDPEVKWFVCFCLGWSEFCQLSLCSRSGSWPQYDSDTKDKQARSAEKTPEKGNIYEVMWDELCGAHKKYSCANQPQPPANHFVVWCEIFFSFLQNWLCLKMCDYGHSIPKH